MLSRGESRVSAVTQAAEQASGPGTTVRSVAASLVRVASAFAAGLNGFAGPGGGLITQLGAKRLRIGHAHLRETEQGLIAPAWVPTPIYLYG